MNKKLSADENLKILETEKNIEEYMRQNYLNMKTPSKVHENSWFRKAHYNQHLVP